MNGWVSLTIPPDPSLVGVARTMAMTAASEADLHPERVQDVRTCISEAVTNAVNAHRSANVSEPIEIRVGTDPQHLTIEIRDHGPGLSPGDGERVIPENPDLTELTVGGYGIPVMQALADDVVLESEGNGAGTVVILRFSLAQRISN